MLTFQLFPWVFKARGAKLQMPTNAYSVKDLCKLNGVQDFVNKEYPHGYNGLVRKPVVKVRKDGDHTVLDVSMERVLGVKFLINLKENRIEVDYYYTNDIHNSLQYFMAFMSSSLIEAKANGFDGIAVKQNSKHTMRQNQAILAMMQCLGFTGSDKVAYNSKNPNGFFTTVFQLRTNSENWNKLEGDLRNEFNNLKSMAVNSLTSIKVDHIIKSYKYRS